MRPRSRHIPKLKTAINPALAQLPAKLQQAIGLHKTGQLAKARSIYEEILKVQPRHFDALHLLGVIAAQAKDAKNAAELIGKALAIDPNNAVAYAAHTHLGAALRELQQLDAALASCNQAIAIKADYAESYYNRGLVLCELRQMDAALASYNQAIAIRADFAEAHSNRGLVLYELKQWEAALASCNQAIAIKANFAEAYSNRGMVLHALKQWDAALVSYDQAIALKADYPEAYSNRGLVLRALGQLDAALASCNQAIAIKADYAEGYSNRGNVLKDLRQLDAALASYNQAIALRADYAEGHSNRGNVLQELQQPGAALVSYNQAIALKADYADAYFNRSLTLLLGGDFDNGWIDYEWRWKNESGSVIREKRNFPQPLWLGNETIAGKTILLYSEQGLGDTLQFCRYVKLVAEMGARVILEVQTLLIGVLATLEGVSHLVAKGSPLPDFDTQCPLMSLPLAFKTNLNTIPSSSKYLRSDATQVAQWQAKLGEKTRARIGLVWSGNSTYKNDHNRSIPLADFIERLPTDFQYVSLQKDVRESDERILESNPQILHFASDFSDTAALCECMDVVVSVDTSIAHLSGALGRRTWILLSYNADWRWLLDRDDSPWYPTATLYRQEKPGDWNGVFEQVKADLIRTFPQST